MEEVWEELKKIEAQAEQIRAEAQDKGKETTKIAEQDAELLLTNSKTSAERRKPKKSSPAPSQKRTAKGKSN